MDMLGTLDTLFDTSELVEDAIKDCYEDRIVVIDKNIDSAILRRVGIHILLWNKDDRDLPVDKRKPIKLYIDSEGGNVFVANNLIDIIQNSLTPVIGVAFSLAASAASDIFIACHERVAFEHTTILLHDGELGVINSTNKAKDTMKFFDQVNDVSKKFILSRTNITEEEYEKNKDREQYMFATDAKEKGIVDSIIGIDCSINYIL